MLCCPGFVNGDTTQLQLYITLPGIIDPGATTITIDSLKMRGQGIKQDSSTKTISVGYPDGNPYTYDWVNSNYTVTGYIANSNTIGIRITHATATTTFTNVIAGFPINFWLYNLTFTLSN